MAVLSEGQVELDGYVFGRPSDPVCILQSGDTTATVGVRNQDVQHPQDDLILFGRDHFSAPVREFLLMIRGDDPDAEMAMLRQAWRADSVRANPLSTSILRWMRYGKTYRAYGRARDFTQVAKSTAEPDARYAQAKFQYRDALVYADSEQSVDLGLISGSLATGLILPAVLPWTLGQVTGQRSGLVTVEGLAAVPFRAMIHGPSAGSATGLKLSGPGWLLDFGTLTLNSGQILTVDTSGIGSAMVGDMSVAGYLTRSSTLIGRMQPGLTELTFAATDASATTTATVSWHAAALII